MSKSESVEKFINSLRSPDSLVRRNGIIELLKTKDPRILEPLIQTAKSDSDSFVRYHAIKALGDFGDKRAIGSLQALLHNLEASDDEKNIELLSAVIEALGKLKDNSMAERFTDFLNHRSWEVVIASIGALRDLEYRPAIDAYRTLLNDPRPFVHITAMACLVNLALKFKIDVEPDLKVLMKDDNESVQKTAKKMLWLYEEKLKDRKQF